MRAAERVPLLCAPAPTYSHGTGVEVPDPSEAAAPLVAITVTHFHPSHGNMIEWQHPKGFSAEGVDFKSIPAGLHDQSEDYVYFQHEGLYGLACFHRLDTQNVREREVRRIPPSHDVASPTHAAGSPAPAPDQPGARCPVINTPDRF